MVDRSTAGMAPPPREAKSANPPYFLDSVSYRYNRYSFDSKSWISEKKLLNDFPFLTSYSFRSLKNYNFYQFKDSLGLYLIKIVD